MHVFGYIRVSSIEQEGGFGPEVQEKAVRAYCAAKGFTDLVLVHESASAESLISRKEIIALLGTAKDLAAAGEEVHIVFRSSDRLARSLTDQESVVATSFSVGFRLHSTLSHEAELFDPAYGADPMRTAMRQVFGVFNQLDKAMIQGRLDGGLFAKAETGGSTGGRYPFGYMGVNQEIVPCPEEIPAVKRAFELERAELDLASTAVVLRREYPAVCGGFTKSSVMRLLRRRELYQFGMYRSRVAASAQCRPELIISPPREGDAAPAIVDVQAPIDWTDVPDPVPAYTLAILLARTPEWVRSETQRLALPARIHKNRLILPLASAQRLEVLARS